MANHSLPNLSSTYANFITEVDARIKDALFWLDSTYTTATNVPTNSIKWDAATRNWKRWNATAWVDHSTYYNLNINGTVGATTPTTGAFTTLTTSGIASLGASSTIGGVAIVGISGAQTLTNKTLTSPVISTIVNTGTLTLPTTTDTLVGRATTDTLTNKTLTAPRIASTGFIADAAGLPYLRFISTASAVNDITITNTSTGASPTITASGSDANIGLNLLTKGTGSVMVNTVPVVTTTATQTLTNKTLTSPVISTIVNTGTLTLPVTTDTLVGRSTTDTLANKTLTTPRFASGGYIADANGAELISFITVASAVNEFSITNAATGAHPTLSATGGDANININLVPKGTGRVQAAGVNLVSISSTDTLTNKTLTSPVISTIVNTGTLTLPTTTDTLVGRATTDTLTNKTLTAPRFATGGFLADASGNRVFSLYSVASAVNAVEVSNVATGSAPQIGVGGSDANIGLTIYTKGTGIATLNGSQIVTNTGTWAISVTGNAATVTNGVYTIGNQTISGQKIFTDNIDIGNGTAGEKRLILRNNIRNTYFYNSTEGIVGLWDATSGAARWTSDTVGNLVATGNITAYSDERLKTDIELIENALDKVSKLNGYTYKRVDTGEIQTGLLAQEVHSVMPEAVIPGTYLSVAYGNLVGLLVEAIKELRAEVISTRRSL